MDRYGLEHESLLKHFYGDCSGLIKDMNENGSNFLAELYRSLGDGKEYEEASFDIGQLEYEGDYIVSRCFLPKPERPAESAILYFFYTSDYEPLRYVTIELSPEGGYTALGWDPSGKYMAYGDFNVADEMGFVEKMIAELDAGEVEIDGRFGEMNDLLSQAELPFREEEIADYLKMFDVIGELVNGKLILSEIVTAFAALVPIMKDPSVVTGRDKMRTMCAKLEELPETAGKLDNKALLFFGFSVYAACNLISENDDKKHYFIGMPEFESAEYIKYKMEEYWALDPFMFSWAVK